MAQVLVEQLEPGMEVAEDVLNANGVLLLGKGAVLTARQIRVLKMWGLEAVAIAGGGSAEAPTESDSGLPPEAMAAAARELGERFKHVGDELPAARIVKALRPVFVSERARTPRISPCCS